MHVHFLVCYSFLLWLGVFSSLGKLFRKNHRCKGILSCFLNFCWVYCRGCLNLFQLGKCCFVCLKVGSRGSWVYILLLFLIPLLFACVFLSGLFHRINLNFLFYLLDGAWWWSLHALRTALMRHVTVLKKALQMGLFLPALGVFPWKLQRAGPRRENALPTLGCFLWKLQRAGPREMYSVIIFYHPKTHPVAKSLYVRPTWKHDTGRETHEEIFSIEYSASTRT